MAAVQVREDTIHVDGAHLVTPDEIGAMWGGAPSWWLSHPDGNMHIVADADLGRHMAEAAGISRDQTRDFRSFLLGKVAPAQFGVLLGYTGGPMLVSLRNDGVTQNAKTGALPRMDLRAESEDDDATGGRRRRGADTGSGRTTAYRTSAEERVCA